MFVSQCRINSVRLKKNGKYIVKKSPVKAHQNHSMALVRSFSTENDGKTVGSIISHFNTKNLRIHYSVDCIVECGSKIYSMILELIILFSMLQNFICASRYRCRLCHMVSSKMRSHMKRTKKKQADAYKRFIEPHQMIFFLSSFFFLLVCPNHSTCIYSFYSCLSSAWFLSTSDRPLRDIMQ